jgi:hypothetical protein
MRAAVVCAKGGDAGPGEKVEAFCPAVTSEQGAADQVVGNQRAEAVDAPARVEGQRKGDAPLRTRASRSGATSFCGYAHAPSALSVSMERWVRAISRPSKAGWGAPARLALDNGDLERASLWLLWRGRVQRPDLPDRRRPPPHHNPSRRRFLVDPGP